jgi:hypothetical protein
MHRSRASLYTFMGLLTGLAFGALGYRAARPEAGVALRPMLVAKTNIRPGEPLPHKVDDHRLSAYFAMEYRPTYQIPSDAVGAYEEAAGMMVVKRLEEGTILRRQHLIRSEGAKISSLKEGEVAYPIEMDTALFELQEWRPGDRVAILALVAENGRPKMVKVADSEILATHLMGKAPEPGNQSVAVRIASLELITRLNNILEENGMLFLVRKDPLVP